MRNQVAKLGTIFFIFINLTNCSSGNSVSDTQTFNLSATNYALNGTAKNCKNIKANGNCSVSIIYSISSTLTAQPINMTTLNGYTSTINTCPQASGQAVSCNFTITNTNGNTSVAQGVRFTFGGTDAFTQNAFDVGGGL